MITSYVRNAALKNAAQNKDGAKHMAELRLSSLSAVGKSDWMPLVNCFLSRQS